MAQGHLFARLAHVNGRTRLIQHQQSAPLKIARTFERPDGGLDICVMDASPGLLAGDKYHFDWVLEAGAKARITTQGATRVHPSAGPVSRQTIQISVGSGAHLELWPETTIPFRGARFESVIKATLEKEAHLILFESLSAGRIARGEAFDFDSVSLQMSVHNHSVHDYNGPRFFVRNRFVPASASLRQPFSWGGATQWSSLFAFGPKWAQSCVRDAQELLEAETMGGGASLLSQGDLAVAMLGQRAYDTRRMALLIESLWNDTVSRETL
jgi:urease accessory protein